MKQGDETVTLWRTLTGALVQSVGVEPVGQFRKKVWCKTHADFVMEHVAVEECRWHWDIDGTKPCVLVEAWMEVA